MHIAVPRLLLRIAIGLLVAVPALAASVAHGAGPTFLTDSNTQQTDSAFTPAQIQTAYDISPLLTSGVDGTGQSIALIEFDRFNPQDIQQFDVASNLPNAVIHQYYVGGKTFTLSKQAETTMDLEWAHAMAPGATLQVYYVNNNQADAAGWKSLATAVGEAQTNGARMISMSFGSCSPSTGYTVLRQALANANARGTSVFVSSGDSGDHPGPRRDCGSKLGVSYPASDPSVVAVGGTSLVLNQDNTIAFESGWSLSGGGKGAPLPRPIWQVAATLGQGKYRYAPDVAFLGDASTGVEVYFRGSWGQAGGTSLGAPAWAAIWALVQQDAQKTGKTVGAAPALIYHIANSSVYTQTFHDITQGSNGRYSAGPGWDPVTGWGTPDTAQLASTVLASAT